MEHSVIDHARALHDILSPAETTNLCQLIFVLCFVQYPIGAIEISRSLGLDSAGLGLNSVDV